LEVFGGAADQGDATNVDFFDNVFLWRSTRHCGFKRIQIHHDQVDVGQVVLGHLGLVSFVVPSVQDAAKHLGVQGFDTSAKDGRVVCHLFDRHHLCTKGFDGCLGAARGINGGPNALEFFDDGCEPLLVVDRDQGRLDASRRGHGQRIEDWKPQIYNAQCGF